MKFVLGVLLVSASLLFLVLFGSSISWWDSAGWFITNFLEYTAYIVVILVLLPLVGWAAAKNDLFFTFIESGDIKFVDSGNSLVKIVHDAQGFRLEGNNSKPMELRLVPGDRFKSPWERLGLYWIGLPPFHSVHSFRIRKEREDLSAPAEASPQDWVKRDPEETIVQSLRFTFPRPYVIVTVELKDNFAVDILVVAKYEVVIPGIPVYIFKGRFFENAGGILKSFILDIVRQMNYDEFLKCPKGEGNGILSKLTEADSELNKQLEKQVGLRLVGISINQWDPSDDSIRNAVRRQKLAEEELKGKVVEAQAYAQSLEITNTADVAAYRNITEVRQQRLESTVNSFKGTGAHPDRVVQASAGVLRAEAVSSESSHINAWVEGGAASVTLPTGSAPSSTSGAAPLSNTPPENKPPANPTPENKPPKQGRRRRNR